MNNFQMEIIFFCFNRALYISIIIIYCYVIYYFHRYLHHKVLKESGNFSSEEMKEIKKSYKQLFAFLSSLIVAVLIKEIP